MWMRLLLSSLSGLLLPPACVLCGAAPSPFTSRRPRRRGLRPWDGPALCADCRGRLSPRPCRRVADGAEEAAPPLFAGRPTDGDLVAVVGAMKYHGVRGAAHELDGLMAAAAESAVREAGAVDFLVPVPLHASRLRERGFNQAGLLAGLLAAAVGIPVAASALRRNRATAQQARLAAESGSRADNVASAFLALPPPAAGAAAGLVDDIITTGATAGAAAAALSEAGWRVRWAVAAGLKSGPGSGDVLDTPGGCS